MKHAPRILSYVTLVLSLLASGCSKPAPPSVMLDDRAGILAAEQQNQLRAAQDLYRQKCQGALAIIVVDAIDRPEVSAYADDEFRAMTWPDWVISATPKVLLLYSRQPELLQTRLNNRALTVEEHFDLQSAVASRTEPMLVEHRSSDALLRAVDTLSAGCSQPEAQGWIKRKFYDYIETEREVVNDYAYPQHRWYSSWYYPLVFEPLLNGFLLLLNLFHHSSWVLILFPLLLAFCLDAKRFFGGGAFYENAKNKNFWYGVSVLSELTAKLLRWFLGAPSYVIVLIALFTRPEDIVTARNHLYSWVSPALLDGLQVQGGIFHARDMLAPAGWLVGLIYFVASAAAQVNSVYEDFLFYEKASTGAYGSMAESYSKRVENDSDAASNLAEEQLKQVGKSLVFSVIIAFAPLALSLYFVIKAVYNALSAGVSRIAALRRAASKPLIRYAPYVVAAVLLVAAYAKMPPQAATVAATPTPTPAPTATVKAKVIYVREKPKPDGRVVGQAKRGEHLAVLGRDGDWVQVRLANGSNGYALQLGLDNTR